MKHLPSQRRRRIPSLCGSRIGRTPRAPAFTAGRAVAFLCILPLMLATTASHSQAAGVPEACARIQHDGDSAPDHGTFHHLTVAFGGSDAVLNASSQSYNGLGSEASDIADATSVLLLSAITGHHNAACSAWLESEGRAAQSALSSGHKAGVAWSGVSIQRGAVHVSAGGVTFTLSDTHGTAEAKLSLSGITTTGLAVPSLMPRSAQAAFSLPQSDLAALMAATGGKASALPAAHVTIQSLSAQRDQISLSGHGTATLTGDVNHTSAAGHLEIRGINDLIAAARQDSQMRIAAALVLARLVSHQSGDANTWDTTWEGGILTVNNVPLPIK